MSDEHGEFCKVLKKTFDVSDTRWKTTRDRRDTAVYTFPIRIIKEGQLLKYLRDEHIRIGDRSHRPDLRIPLPPIKDEPSFVPLLRVNWNFREEDNETQLQNSLSVDMIRCDNMQIFSYRYDQRSPGSDHDFFHVQVNNEVPALGDFESFSWMPGSRPCVPLRAEYPRSPVSLFLILYGSLYGFKDVDKDLSGIHPRYLKETKPFLTQPDC